MSKKIKIAKNLFQIIFTSILLFSANHVLAQTPEPPVTSTPVQVLVSEGFLPSQINGGPGIVTISNLVPGMQYQIVISGVVNYSSSIQVDPQWNDSSPPSSCFLPI